MKTVKSDWFEQRIVIPGRNTFLPYYTNSPWSSDESYFILFSATDGFKEIFLHTYDPAQGKIRSEVPLPHWFGRPFEAVSEELISAAFLPEAETLLIPRGNELFLTGLFTGKTELFYAALETDCRIGGPVCTSPDGRFIAFGAYRRQEYHRLPVFDRQTGELLSDIDFAGFNADHFQFQSDSTFITFAHEGPTEEIFDRINRINWKTGKKEVLHQHQTGENGELLECIGHEMTRGKTIAAVRYPVSRLPGALVVMNEDGNNYTILDCDDYWHCSCNGDGNIFVMDTMWWGNSKRKQEHCSDIIRIDRTHCTKEIVKTIDNDPRGQYRHPHPQLNVKGDKILFHEEFNRQFSAITLMTL